MSQFIEMFEGEKYPRLSLDEICKEWSKGQGFKKDDICEDGETQCIHYGELFTKYGPVINEVISRTSVEKKKTSKKGDILFPASDVTPNGLARCSMLPFDNVILGGDIIILRPKDKYNPAYLSYAINQQTSQLLTRVNGGVVKHMSAKGLKTVEIPIPPMDKQGEYIQIAEQADKSEFVGFKSQFIEMFGNPVANNKGWSTMALKQVAPEEPSRERQTGTVWILNLDMIESHTGKIIDKVYDEDTNLLSVASFDEGNVLYSKLRPYLNKVVIPKGKGYATTELVPLRPNQEYLNLTFFSHLLRGDDFVTYANTISSGTKMPRMPLNDLRNFQCILPPMEEQLKFEKVAEQADKSEFELRKSIEAIDQVIKSLINN